MRQIARKLNKVELRFLSECINLTQAGEAIFALRPARKICVLRRKIRKQMTCRGASRGLCGVALKLFVQQRGCIIGIIVSEIFVVQKVSSVILDHILVLERVDCPGVEFLEAVVIAVVGTDDRKGFADLISGAEDSVLTNSSAQAIFSALLIRSSS